MNRCTDQKRLVYFSMHLFWEIIYLWIYLHPISFTFGFNYILIVFRVKTMVSSSCYLSSIGCGWYFYQKNWPMQSSPFWMQSSIISFRIDSNLNAKAAPFLIDFICSSFSFNYNNAVKRLFVLIIAKTKKKLTVSFNINIKMRCSCL